jgi:hypothetical protein
MQVAYYRHQVRTHGHRTLDIDVHRPCLYQLHHHRCSLDTRQTRERPGPDFGRRTNNAARWRCRLRWSSNDFRSCGQNLPRPAATEPPERARALAPVSFSSSRASPSSSPSSCAPGHRALPSLISRPHSTSPSVQSKRGTTPRPLILTSIDIAIVDYPSIMATFRAVCGLTNNQLV